MDRTRERALDEDVVELAVVKSGIDAANGVWRPRSRFLATYWSSTGREDGAFRLDIDRALVANTGHRLVHLPHSTGRNRLPCFAVCCSVRWRALGRHSCDSRQRQLLEPVLIEELITARKTDVAKVRLQQLIDKYPDTEAGKTAKEAWRPDGWPEARPGDSTATGHPHAHRQPAATTPLSTSSRESLATHLADLFWWSKREPVRSDRERLWQRYRNWLHPGRWP